MLNNIEAFEELVGACNSIWYHSQEISSLRPVGIFSFLAPPLPPHQLEILRELVGACNSVWYHSRDIRFVTRLAQFNFFRPLYVYGVFGWRQKFTTTWLRKLGRLVFGSLPTTYVAPICIGDARFLKNFGNLIIRWSLEVGGWTRLQLFCHLLDYSIV